MLHKRNLPISKYIKAAHSARFKFFYVMNALSLHGKEWCAKTQKIIYEKVKRLVEAEVDGLTIASPIIALRVKEQFPDLEIFPSVVNQIDSIEKARQSLTFFQYDGLILDPRKSRNFKLMKIIKEAFPYKPLTVLVNESCIIDCSLHGLHLDDLASASRIGEKQKNPDFCHIICAREKLSNPIHVLKAPWIRPEDVGLLFRVGVSHIKLAGRTMSTSWIANLVDMYRRGKYEGNIWPYIEKSGLWAPEWEGMLRKDLGKCHYELRNELLNGFITPFFEGKVPCVRDNGCYNCCWCISHLSAVRSPKNKVERLQDLDRLLCIVGK